ncbi:MAG: ankyrin repeat domain-containing protein [Alphaproteobacteria bacterium]|nr:ankyrin repeat domain-containing protein [Alphaproteobacteria bacterium]
MKKYLLFGTAMLLAFNAYASTDELVSAAQNGDWAKVQDLISAGDDINGTNAAGNTALHYAVNANNIDMIRFLLDHGAKSDIENTKGWSAFSIAEKKGNEAVVNLINSHEFEDDIDAIVESFSDAEVKAPAVEAPKVEVKAPTVEAPKVEVKAPKVEAPKVEVKAPTVEAPKVEVKVPAVEAPKVEVKAPAVEAPKVEVKAPTVEAPKVEVKAPKVEAPKVEVKAPKVEAPKVEVKAPAVEAPKVEVKAPAVEAPKAEVKVPTVEAPKVEVKAPAVEAPKAEVKVPTVEAPKAEVKTVAKPIVKAAPKPTPKPAPKFIPSSLNKNISAGDEEIVYSLYYLGLQTNEHNMVKASEFFAGSAGISKERHEKIAAAAHQYYDNASEAEMKQMAEKCSVYITPKNTEKQNQIIRSMNKSVGY